MSGIHLALLGSNAADAVITITDQTVSDLDATAAYAWYFVTSGGQIEYSTQAGGINPVNIEQWCTPTTQAANYEVRVTVTLGALSGGSGTGTWLAISGGTRNWYVEEFVSGATNLCMFTVEIRRTGTTTVLDSATITLEAQVL